MTAPKLPELPPYVHRFAVSITPTGERMDYTAHDMHAHGLACALWAFEEAILTCVAEAEKWGGGGVTGPMSRLCAVAIRAKAAALKKEQG